MACLFNLEKLSLIIILFITVSLFLCSSTFQTCLAREGKSIRQEKATATYLFSHPHGSRRLSNNPSTFNVIDYGAKGDGLADDTKAFEEAWAAACKQEATTIEVPSGSTFLVYPISFSGPNCAANIVFQLDGTIIAPTSAEAWEKGVLQWIEFTKLNGITISGNGVIDGKGSVWWNTQHSKMPSKKPTALRFYGSTDVTVTGITIRNSPQTHLKFDDCTTVQVSGFTTSSPKDSPNTDGIHLQNSIDVLIHHTQLSCGDDCISIQTGCSKVSINDVNCGPGHGISIGSLGKDSTKACVSNVTIRDVKMQDTMTGVRIKTWQGGSGSVQGITFSNIQVSQVETPIMIDQYYCDGGKCKNESSAVAVSGINYVNIKGTYTKQPLHFACSDSLPCTAISLDAIELTPTGEDSRPFCWKTYGDLKSKIVPPVDCLQKAKSRNPVVC